MTKSESNTKTNCFKFRSLTLLGLLVVLVLTACSSPAPSRPTWTPPPVKKAPPPSADPIGDMIGKKALPGSVLDSMGYGTQVGAFQVLDNAVRLERKLKASGIDAYYFRHESGLYKVRFGNHPTYAKARRQAESLQARGLIDRFFIVIPEEYAAARIARTGKGNIRQELVRTAKRFIGVPYRWGGTDSNKGFDCSGLTMVTYRLNGLNLPRVSRNQFKAGRWVSRSRLQPGDLVFFATQGGRRVSHVGMYVGSNRFIHAPRTGKTVRIVKLNSSYWSKRYVGARSYL